jgi:hypothetical protein
LEARDFSRVRLHELSANDIWESYGGGHIYAEDENEAFYIANAFDASEWVDFSKDDLTVYTDGQEYLLNLDNVDDDDKEDYWTITLRVVEVSLDDLDDEEIAQIIKDDSEWNPEACEQLCIRAGLADEWDAADGENFESVVEKAADELGVNIF